MVKFTSWSLYTREGTPLPIEHEAGWAPEMVRTFGEEERKVACLLPAFESTTVQPLSLVTVLTALLRCFEKLDSLLKTLQFQSGEDLYRSLPV